MTSHECKLLSHQMWELAMLLRDGCDKDSQDIEVSMLNTLQEAAWMISNYYRQMKEE